MYVNTTCSEYLIRWDWKKTAAQYYNNEDRDVIHIGDSVMLSLSGPWPCSLKKPVNANHVLILASLIYYCTVCIAQNYVGMSTFHNDTTQTPSYRRPNKLYILKFVSKTNACYYVSRPYVKIVLIDYMINYTDFHKTKPYPFS